MAKSKKPLTEEQKHRKRVAAAKKAAKTRKANIPDEVKKAKAAEKRARTMAKKRKALIEEAYQRNRAAKRQTAAFQRRSAAAKKGWETRRAIDRGMKCIDTLRKMIASWAPMPYWSESMTIVKRSDRNSLEAVLNSSIQMNGEREIAIRLEKDADVNIDYADTILWDSNEDRVDTAKAHLYPLLTGGPIDAKKAKEMADKFTEDELAEANAELDFLGIF